MKQQPKEQQSQPMEVQSQPMEVQPQPMEVQPKPMEVQPQSKQSEKTDKYVKKFLPQNSNINFFITHFISFNTTKQTKKATANQKEMELNFSTNFK